MKITKKIGLLLVIGLSFVGSYGQSAYGQLASVDVNPTEYMLPQLKTGNNEIDGRQILKVSLLRKDRTGGREY